MAFFETLPWQPSFEGLSRKDRMGGVYRAYFPDALAGWEFDLPADLVADISDAEREVLSLQSGGALHVSLEGMARFLLRAESVSSSHIEGLSAAARRLARAEAALDGGRDPSDQAACEILGNIRAMERAVALGTQTKRLTVDTLLELHRELMQRSVKPEIGGVVRSTQNWIGGSSYNPCTAEFVPPPPEEVPGLLEDLMHYVDGDTHSPVLQAAIAHAQLETIHPFADGNGRAGRALIHVILRRRGLTPQFVPPVSLVLATWSRDYIDGLTRFRHGGPSDGAQRAQGAQAWIRTFSAALRRSCQDANAFRDEITVMVEQWRERLGSVRKDSGLDRLLRVLPGLPILTRATGAAHIGRTPRRTGDAIDTLLDAGILVQRNVGRERYRVFEVPEVLDLFTSLERRLASPEGDTFASPVTRRVPDRP
ncbi:Adenosine monophosphate-protein transferase SoFic [Planctomycetes bacterium Poly30]|uniref:Adenosine monophosphate-protein transferase SoFic n=1 Tax=Saltatorellus ferox TaxID=2528018 RepID=A0A518F045_9BACT|nr:Adenosine monophosphate-protein transferase SoFic [Planctomycetes bacterium Poly30]